MYGLIAILLSLLSVSFAQTCNYIASDGTAYNLTTARNNAVDYSFDDSAAQFTYLINFCGPTIVPCNGSAACMEPFFSIDNYYSLGSYATETVVDVPNDGWAGLTLKYTNGSDCPEIPGTQRTITINVQCAYGANTTFVSANQDIDCTFTAYFISAAACPSKCPEGKRGANCTICLEGYYGPDCKPCQCKFGTCNSTDGSCACQQGWSGPLCDTCAPGRCSFNASAGAFLYNITSLAQHQTDYHFINEQEYWINLLARTNNPCNGLKTPVCMEDVNGTFFSLGTLESETVTALPFGAGIQLTYQNGSPCPGVANTFLSVEVTLYCISGYPTTVISSEQPGECFYTIEMDSGVVCPQCGRGMYGPTCTPCACSNSIGCFDGFNGNGSCICETGFQGDLCNECEPGYFGETCKACECDKDHSLCLDGVSGSGNCICFAGYGGDNCSTKQDEVDHNQVYTWGGVGLAIGLVVGIGIAVGACIYSRSKRRDYEVVKG